MIVKTIKYTDYNGEKREEDFYFNYSRAEMIEMEASVEGGMNVKIKKIIQSKSTKEAMVLIKDIILGAYGIKSDDGKRFIKTDDIRKSFEESESCRRTSSAAIWAQMSEIMASFSPGDAGSQRRNSRGWASSPSRGRVFMARSFHLK